MKHKIGDKVKVFKIDIEVEIVDIVKGVFGDIYGSIISAYKIKNSNRLYTDVYDGTISEI